ncbi:hypothetical protein HMPREF3216_00308, partial [Gardnerella vaginalis]
FQRKRRRERAVTRERFSLLGIARGLSISLLAGAPICLRA